MWVVTTGIPVEQTEARGAGGRWAPTTPGAGLQAWGGSPIPWLWGQCGSLDWAGSGLTKDQEPLHLQVGVSCDIRLGGATRPPTGWTQARPWAGTSQGLCHHLPRELVCVGGGLRLMGRGQEGWPDLGLGGPGWTGGPCEVQLPVLR